MQYFVGRSLREKCFLLLIIFAFVFSEKYFISSEQGTERIFHENYSRSTLDKVSELPNANSSQEDILSGAVDNSTYLNSTIITNPYSITEEDYQCQLKIKDHHMVNSFKKDLEHRKQQNGINSKWMNVLKSYSPFQFFNSEKDKGKKYDIINNKSTEERVIPTENHGKLESFINNKLVKIILFMGSLYGVYKISSTYTEENGDISNNLQDDFTFFNTERNLQISKEKSEDSMWNDKFYDWENDPNFVHLGRDLQGIIYNDIDIMWQEIVSKDAIDLDNAGYNFFCNAMQKSNPKYCTNSITPLFSFYLNTRLLDSTNENNNNTNEQRENFQENKREHRETTEKNKNSQISNGDQLPNLFLEYITFPTTVASNTNNAPTDPSNISHSTTPAPTKKARKKNDIPLMEDLSNFKNRIETSAIPVSSKMAEVKNNTTLKCMESAIICQNISIEKKDDCLVKQGCKEDKSVTIPGISGKITPKITELSLNSSLLNVTYTNTSFPANSSSGTPPIVNKDRGNRETQAPGILSSQFLAAASKTYSYLNQFNNIFRGNFRYENLFPKLDPGNDIRGPKLIAPLKVSKDNIYQGISLDPITGNLIAIMGPYTLSNDTLPNLYYGRDVNEAGEIMSKRLYIWNEAPQFYTGLQKPSNTSYNFTYYGKPVTVNCQTQVNRDNFINITNHNVFTSACLVNTNQAFNLQYPNHINPDGQILPEATFFVNSHSLSQKIINNIAYGMLSDDGLNSRNNRQSYLSTTSYHTSTLSISNSINLNTVNLIDQGNGILQLEISIGAMNWAKLPITYSNTLSYKSRVVFFNYDMTHGADLGNPYLNFQNYLRVNGRYDDDTINNVVKSNTVSSNFQVNYNKAIYGSLFPPASLISTIYNSTNNDITGSYFWLTRYDQSPSILIPLCWTNSSAPLSGILVYCPLFRDTALRPSPPALNCDPGASVQGRTYADSTLYMWNPEGIFIDFNTINGANSVSAVPVARKNDCSLLRWETWNMCYSTTFNLIETTTTCQNAISDEYKMSSGLSDGQTIKAEDMLSRVPGSEQWDETLWPGFIAGNSIVYAFNSDGKDLYRMNKAFPNTKLATMNPFSFYTTTQDLTNSYPITTNLQGQSAAYALIYRFYLAGLPNSTSFNSIFPNSTVPEQSVPTYWDSMIFDMSNKVKMGCKNASLQLNCVETNGYGLPKNSNSVNILDSNTYNHVYYQIGENLPKKFIHYNVDNSVNNCELASLNHNVSDIYIFCKKANGNPFFAINGAQNLQYYYVNSIQSTNTTQMNYTLVDGKKMFYLPARSYSFSPTDGRNYPGKMENNLIFTSIMDKNIYIGNYVKLNHKNRQVFTVNNRDNIRTQLVYPNLAQSFYENYYIPYGRIVDTSTGEISLCQLNSISAVGCMTVHPISLMAPFPYISNNIKYLNSIPSNMVGNLTAEQFLSIQLSKPVGERVQAFPSLSNNTQGLYQTYRIPSYTDNKGFTCNLIFSPSFENLQDSSNGGDIINGVPVATYCINQDNNQMQFVQTLGKGSRDPLTNTTEWQDLYWHICYVENYLENNVQKSCCNFITPTNIPINCLINKGNLMPCINVDTGNNIDSADVQVFNNTDLKNLLNLQGDSRFIRLNPVHDFMMYINTVQAVPQNYNITPPEQPEIPQAQEIQRFLPIYEEYSRLNGINTILATSSLVFILLLNLLYNCSVKERFNGKFSSISTENKNIFLKTLMILDFLFFVGPNCLDYYIFSQMMGSPIFTSDSLGSYITINPLMYKIAFNTFLIKTPIYGLSILSGLFHILSPFIPMGFLEKAKSAICTRKMFAADVDIFLPLYGSLSLIQIFYNMSLYYYYARNNYLIQTT